VAFGSSYATERFSRNFHSLPEVYISACHAAMTEFVAVSSIWIAIVIYLAQSVVGFLGKKQKCVKLLQICWAELATDIFDTALLLMNLEIIVDIF